MMGLLSPMPWPWAPSYRTILRQKAPCWALQAGADILLMPYDYIAAYQGVLTAVEDGTIPEERH